MVGFWKLTADWGKGDYRGIHLLELRQDLTGTIRELGEELPAKLSKVKVEDNAIQFSFFFDGKEGVEIKFAGKLKRYRPSSSFP
ncbi:MAG: hypothetical protein AAF394_04320 [Planctomycetota bacterium]